MKNYHCSPTILNNSRTLLISDHLDGFDQNYYSARLDQVVNFAQENAVSRILTAYILPESVKQRYPNIRFAYQEDLVGGQGWKSMQTYRVHPALEFKNFVCSFNGSPHVSRKLLVAALKKFDIFDPNYSSKNFPFTAEILEGHIKDLVSDDRERYFRKFFVGKDSENFFQSIYSFGHTRFDHDKNIHTLESKLTQSFLHVVSETMATSYIPFVTEKFLYSIVTRGLFLAYAQPKWHAHIEKYFGFKPYTKLFNYEFDSINNPVQRLIELMSMISKFKMLSAEDWSDLYLMELDTIEYNYNHYFSQDYLKCLANYE